MKHICQIYTRSDRGVTCALLGIQDLEGIRDMLRQELSDAQQQIDDLGARWSESARKLKEVEADYKKASVANTAMVAEVRVLGGRSGTVVLSCVLGQSWDLAEIDRMRASVK